MSDRVATLAVIQAIALAGCGGGGGTPGGDAAAEVGRDSSPDAGSDAAPDGGPSSCAGLDFQAFDATVSGFLAAKGLAGASAVVVHRDCGVVHTAGYGRYTADRVYLVGSSSKVISVGVLMRLADRGLIDLDASVGDHLAGWAANGKAELKMAQLLSNSSGLVGLVDNPIYVPYLCQYRAAGTLGDCGQAIYTANDAATRVTPDTAFHYGGGQWQLAGGIAEVVGGQRWADLVRSTYADLCDVPSLGYTNQFQQAGQSGSAFGYPTFFQGDVTALPATDNPSVEGGMFISARDYGKLLLMHLRGGICDGGRVLSEQAVARMRVDRILEVYGGSTAGQTGRQAGGDAVLEGYGLGWWIDRGHPGVFADPGLYGAFPWLDLPRGYGALVAIESEGDVGGQLWATIKPVLDELFDASAR